MTRASTAGIPQASHAAPRPALSDTWMKNATCRGSDEDERRDIRLGRRKTA